jgi:hypothetical protein
MGSVLGKERRWQTQPNSGISAARRRHLDVARLDDGCGVPMVSDGDGVLRQLQRGRSSCEEGIGGCGDSKSGRLDGGLQRQGNQMETSSGEESGGTVLFDGTERASGKAR